MKDLAGNEYVPSKAYNSTGCYAGGNAEVCFAWDGVRVTPTEFAEKARLVSIERDQLRAEVERLRRQRTEFDCRYTLGDVADISGSHCPLDSKCQRCKREDAELQIREFEKAKAKDVEILFDILDTLGPFYLHAKALRDAGRLKDNMEAISQQGVSALCAGAFLSAIETYEEYGLDKETE